MPSKKPKFQSTLYVAKRIDGDVEFLVADEDIACFDNGEEVAVYELRDVRSKAIGHALLPKANKAPK